MKSIFDLASCHTLSGRIERLTVDSRPLWGTMDVGRMVCQASDQLRAALGEFKMDGAGGLYALPPGSLAAHQCDPVAQGRGNRPGAAFHPTR